MATVEEDQKVQPQENGCQNVQAHSIDELNKDAFCLVSRFINRVPLSEQARTAFLWGTTISTAKSRCLTKTFVDLLTAGKVEFAMIPETDQIEWRETDIAAVEKTLGEFEIISKSFTDGTGHIKLRYLSFDFMMRFVKKVSRYSYVYLNDDAGFAVNARHWKKCRLFIYPVFKSSRAFSLLDSNMRNVLKRYRAKEEANESTNNESQLLI